MNGILGDLPVGFKMIVRDFVRAHFEEKGEYELTKRSMKTIGLFVKKMKRDYMNNRDPKLVSKVIRKEREFLQEYFRIADRDTWGTVKDNEYGL